MSVISFEFTKFITSQTVEDELLVSFDAVSLFPKIATQLGIETIIWLVNYIEFFIYFAQIAMYNMVVAQMATNKMFRKSEKSFLHVLY